MGSMIEKGNKEGGGDDEVLARLLQKMRRLVDRINNKKGNESNGNESKGSGQA